MHTKLAFVTQVALVTLFSILNFQLSTAFAQGTAFTYQGRLIDNGNPAHGTYDFRIKLFIDPFGSTQAGTTMLTNGVSMTNGMFTVMLDFGAGIFNGSNYWLEVDVRTNGAAGYANLNPLQAVIPTPYAIFANTASNLSGTLPTTQLSGTIPSSQLPGGVVTNNEMSLNLSGAFNGSYSGNVGGLTNVAGALPWKIVSGTSQQAQPNTGYLLTNDSQVTITLPISPNIGDVVRVCGSGAGGWKIAQNAGQFVSSGNLVGNIGVVWTAHGPSTNWISVASSADGVKLVAAVYNGSIYTSTDSGVTWTAQIPSTNWVSVASSADGTKLVAAAVPGQIYTSTDSGATWMARAIKTNWQAVASSMDGTKLVAGVYSGQIYTSTDSGVTWTAHAFKTNWQAVASAADGTKLVAAVDGGQIYTSTDSGATWTARDSSRSWTSVASSADGTKLVATVNHGQIYTSTDSGTNWTGHAIAANQGWWNVASSSDGTKLVVANFGNGPIYTSTDSGTNWMAHGITRSWDCVASSSDGTKLVAGDYYGQIYTSVPSNDISNTSTGTAGYLSGVQNTAIELQYIGNGQFMPISFVGAIQSF